MNAAGRLSLYTAGLVVVFGAAYFAASALVPDSLVAEWNQGGHATETVHED